MADSNATSGFGTHLFRAGYHVAELTSLNGVTMSGDAIDVTSHDSDDNAREYIRGMIDGGELSIEGNFIPTDTNGQIAMKGDLDSGTSRAYEMVFPMSMGVSWEFDGIVSAFETDAPIDDKVSVSSTIKVSGKPSLNTTQSAGLTTPFLAVADNSANAITLSPTVGGSTYEYTGTALTGATSVTITPTAATGTIRVNGVAVATGVASGAISLGDAGTQIVVWCTVKESSKSSKVYKITITRASA